MTASGLDGSSTILTGWSGFVRLSLGLLSPLSYRTFILWLINHIHWIVNIYQVQIPNPGWGENKQYLLLSYLSLKTQSGEDEKFFESQMFAFIS